MVAQSAKQQILQQTKWQLQNLSWPTCEKHRVWLLSSACLIYKLSYTEEERAEFPPVNVFKVGGLYFNTSKS